MLLPKETGHGDIPLDFSIGASLDLIWEFVIKGHSVAEAFFGAFLLAFGIASLAHIWRRSQKPRPW